MHHFTGVMVTKRSSIGAGFGQGFRGRAGDDEWISCSVSCAGDAGGHEFGGRPQLRGIGLRHAADIAVLEGATTCPFHHFGDGLLLRRSDAPCRRQEFIPKLIES